MTNAPPDDFLEAARAYAARHPDDRGHARLLASLTGPTPAASPRRPALDLAAARAQLAAARRAAEEERAALIASVRGGRARTRAVEERARARAEDRTPKPPSRPVTLDVGAVRRRRTPPVQPPSARPFHTAAGWRWTYLTALGPDIDRTWSSLAAGLIAAGPFQSLSSSRGPLGTTCGTIGFEEHQGVHWATLTLRDGLPPDQVRPTMAHELAHLGDYAVAGTAWPRVFSDPARCARSERFAYDAEGWVTPSTPAATLIAAARAFETTAGRRRAS
ncbi:hypothetical protein AB0N09_21760 [Streptomyces erythrochromogenes]|uniref:hypothetical protein n=1 Tax=Streptomyces erythrochromogenes TaxID=285574 RepID=UPI003437636B